MVLFKNRFFRRWSVINWLSLMGDSLYYIALIAYAATLPNPSLGILIISISETIPRVFQIILGAYADATFQKTKRIIQSGVFRGISYVVIGLIIMNSSSLAALLLIGLLNVFSDLFGNFSTLCKSPFIRFIVKEEELEEALGINTAVTGSILMLAGFFGVALIGFFSIHFIAFFNAFIFFVVAAGTKLLQHQVINIERKIIPVEVKSVKALFSHIYYSIKTLVKIKELRNFFFIASGLNVLALSYIPIILLYFMAYPEVIWVSSAFSIALINGLMTFISILGGLIGPKYFNRLNTGIIFTISILGSLIFAISVWTRFIWVGIFAILIGCFTTSLFNVRFNTIIQKIVPAEMMGSFTGAKGVFFTTIPGLISIAMISIGGISLTIFSLLSTIFCIGLIVAIIKAKINLVDFQKISLKR